MSQVVTSVDWHVGDAVASRRSLKQTRTDSNADLGRPSAALVVFWVVCLVLAVVSHYAISGRLNLAYRAVTVLVILLTPFTPGFFSLFQKRAVIWLMLFELVLIVGCLTGYTGAPSDLVSVNADPIVMLRALPFLLCGLTLSRFPRAEKRWIFALLVLFTMVQLPDAVTFARGSMAGLRRERILTEAFDEASANAILSGYYNLSVACLIIAILGNRLRDLVTRYWRWLLVALQCILASVCFTAGYTAAALLFFISIGLLGVTAPVRTLRFRLTVLGGVAILIPTLWLGLAAVAQDARGSFGQIFRRLDGLRVALFTGEVTKDTSKATSGRLELGRISLRSFLASPLIGLGKGRASSEIKGHDSDTIGGHSYILDSLGQRGLLGSLPLLAALWCFLATAYRNLRRAPSSWRTSAMVTIMPMWIVAMIINPYFLGHIALNHIVFLCFGLILGDAARLQWPGNGSRAAATHTA